MKRENVNCFPSECKQFERITQVDKLLPEASCNCLIGPLSQVAVICCVDCKSKLSIWNFLQPQRLCRADHSILTLYFNYYLNFRFPLLSEPWAWCGNLVIGQFWLDQLVRERKFIADQLSLTSFFAGQVIAVELNLNWAWTKQPIVWNACYQQVFVTIVAETKPVNSKSRKN